METSISITFEDNKLLTALYGEHNKNLSYIEAKYGVIIAARGGNLLLTGSPEAINSAKFLLEELYKKTKKGIIVNFEEIDAVVRFQSEPDLPLKPKKSEEAAIKTRKKTVTPRSPMQRRYVESLLANDLVFATGPAGTGKTYLAVAVAVHYYLTNKVERIVLSRPAVEAGEKLGFLPGDLKEKIDPYLRPLYDALHDMLPADVLARCMENDDIEIAPLAFMRGRTLSNAYIILDEAQNTTQSQMKMFLTRLGVGSKMVVTGDLSQIDLPKAVHSGLKDATDKLTRIKNVGHVIFSDVDIVRHPLAAEIVKAYKEAEDKASSDEDY